MTENLFGEKSIPEGFGQDERSLVKLPFTTVSKSRKKDRPIELSATWTARLPDGKTVKFFKTVTASAKYGLPEYPCEEVYVALLYYAARSNLKQREVQVVPRHLLKLMQWDVNGAAYKRLKRSLHQLATVYIHTNALWDDKKEKFVEAGFGVIDDWRIEKGEAAPLFGVEDADLLTISWNERLFEHFQAGRFKLINVSIYYSLSTPLARRLYRWVDEALYPTGRTEIDIRHLAHNRLEISRSRTYPSTIMQSLRPALEELSERGVFRWSLEDSKTDSGKKLVFQKGAPELVVTNDRESTAEGAVSFDQLRDEYNKLSPSEKEQIVAIAKQRLRQLLFTNRHQLRHVYDAYKQHGVATSEVGPYWEQQLVETYAEHRLQLKST